MSDASPAAPVAFIDLAAQQRRIADKIEAAIKRLLDHGRYIMGPEVARFEDDLTAFCGARHAISCSNGTDAIALILMAWDLRPGDAVFCPSFTFASTGEVVPWLGATPVFVDIDPATYNMSPQSLEAAIALAKQAGLKPKVVMPVDLFGQPADYARLEEIAEAHGMKVLCDAAQGFGAVYQDRKVGTIGQATTTSFFPAKPLGCYGDGGAIFTDDDDLAAILRSLRVHGAGSEKYDNVRIGMNGRLDTLQAAILIEKLAIFPDEIEARNAVAARYNEALSDICTTPHVLEGATSVWAQYTIRVAEDRRDAVIAELKARGIPAAVYYPKPLHEQTAFQRFRTQANLAASESAAREVLSLPMHPYLDATTQDRIISACREILP